MTPARESTPAHFCPGSRSSSAPSQCDGHGVDQCAPVGVACRLHSWLQAQPIENPSPVPSCLELCAAMAECGPEVCSAWSAVIDDVICSDAHRAATFLNVTGDSTDASGHSVRAKLSDLLKTRDAIDEELLQAVAAHENTEADFTQRTCMSVEPPRLRETNFQHETPTALRNPVADALRNVLRVCVNDISAKFEAATTSIEQLCASEHGTLDSSTENVASCEEAISRSEEAVSQALKAIADVANQRHHAASVDSEARWLDGLLQAVSEYPVDRTSTAIYQVAEDALETARSNALHLQAEKEQIENTSQEAAKQNEAICRRDFLSAFMDTERVLVELRREERALHNEIQEKLGEHALCVFRSIESDGFDGLGHADLDGAVEDSLMRMLIAGEREAIQGIKRASERIAAQQSHDEDKRYNEIADHRQRCEEMKGIDTELERTQMLINRMTRENKILLEQVSALDEQHRQLLVSDIPNASNRAHANHKDLASCISEITTRLQNMDFSHDAHVRMNGSWVKASGMHVLSSAATHIREHPRKSQAAPDELEQGSPLQRNGHSTPQHHRRSALWRDRAWVSPDDQVLEHERVSTGQRQDELLNKGLNTRLRDQDSAVQAVLDRARRTLKVHGIEAVNEQDAEVPRLREAIRTFQDCQNRIIPDALSYAEIWQKQPARYAAPWRMANGTTFQEWETLRLDGAA